MDIQRVETLSSLIRQWVSETEGRFTTREIDSELGIETREGKGLRRAVIKQLCDKGTIRRLPNAIGVYRRVDADIKLLNWRIADPSKIIKLKFTFGIEEYVEIYPKNIIIIGGSKDAGKTAYVLNLIALNMYEFDIWYFSSESGDLELKKRLLRFQQEGIVGLDQWRFNAVERSRDFADIIKPNAVNIIDYLEIYENFYEIGGLINDIYEQLRDGIAIIVLQKNPGLELPLGKGRGLEKARLYLAMDPGELTIRVAKNRARDTVNPIGKKFTYKLIQGAKFIET